MKDPFLQRKGNLINKIPQNFGIIVFQSCKISSARFLNRSKVWFAHKPFEGSTFYFQ